MKKKKAVLLDINIFSQEGFTNGIFLTFKEFFKRFEKKNIHTEIWSLSDANTSITWGGKKFGRNSRKEQGINIEEVIIDGGPTNKKEEYLKGIDVLLQESQPDVIFMYTPAVFFEEIHIESLQKAIDSGAKVKIILADALYPTSDKHPAKDVSKYYKLLRDTEVICTSKTIIKKFKKDTGIEATFFPNIFSPKDIIAKNAKNDKRYITLVNHHPVKGIEIFNEIARRMPEKEFLVVETWPDVPNYNPPTDNITFSQFIEDVRELYAKTKIILMPSLYHEGPSRLMIEGMLNHIPVIAHDIGSLAEVGDDFAIFITPPNIKSSPMKGTIIHPQIDESELNDVVDRFIEKINRLDSGELAKKYRDEAYDKAIKHCKNVDNKLSNLINKWFYSKGQI